MKEQRIGQNIAVLRKKSRTTQEQLAQVLHVSPQAVSKWEKGLTVPDTCTIPLIAEYFHVTIDFLYFGKAEEMTGEEKKNELRAKENEKNRLLYSYWKEDELNELTDEEFAVLQKKVNLHRTQPMKGGTAYFREFFGGKNDCGIPGDPVEFAVYKRKLFMYRLRDTYFYSAYERMFSFARNLGITHIYDIGNISFPDLQAMYLIHDPAMHYTGVEDRMFQEWNTHVSAEHSYLNSLFEQFTGSDRIRFIRDRYPCELEIAENSVGVMFGCRILIDVEWEEDLVKRLGGDFDRFILELAGATNNTDVAHMKAKDVVYQEVAKYKDIRGEQLDYLREYLPDHEFYVLSGNRHSLIVYGTRFKSDRAKIEARYELMGNRVVTDLIDSHLFWEMRE